MTRTTSLRPLRRAGFTLLEILIVLAVLGGLAALAGPSLPKLYDQVSFALARDDVERSLAALPRRALESGKSMTLRDLPVRDGQVNEGAAILPLPPDWRLDVAKPVIYRGDGLCLGGDVVLKAKTVVVAYRLEPPFCVPKEARRP